MYLRFMMDGHKLRFDLCIEVHDCRQPIHGSTAVENISFHRHLNMSVSLVITLLTSCFKLLLLIELGRESESGVGEGACFKVEPESVFQI